MSHRSVLIVSAAATAALLAVGGVAYLVGGGWALAVALASAAGCGLLGLVLSGNARRSGQELAAEMARLAVAIRQGDLDVALVPVETLEEAMVAQRAAAELAVRFAHDTSEFLTTFNGGVVPRAFPGKFEGVMQRAADMSKTFTDMINMRNADVNMLLQACLQGQMDLRAETSKYSGYNGKLVEALNSVLDAVRGPLKDATAALERLAKRDLTARMAGEYPGDYARVKEAVNSTAKALHEALEQVSRSTGQVSGAATQISASSQAVAAGASQQASSLEETSSSLESMTSMVKTSAENAQQASALAQSARSMAGEGAGAMQEMSQAMEKIRASAEGTSQIIKDINEIAFQTNLLALNAAVEAARAGDAGRGFAVVAEEVRSLALRSKEAANKTEALIRESVRQTGEGDATAKLVAGKLTEITGMVGKVTDIVTEIAASAREQANGIAQVAKAVAEVSQVTQQNASSSEQASSAALELSGQSDELAGIVSSFRLGAGTAAPKHGPKPARPAAPPAKAVARPAAPPQHAAPRPAAPPKRAPVAHAPVAQHQPVVKQGANGKNGTQGIQLKPEEIIPLEGDPSFDEF